MLPGLPKFPVTMIGSWPRPQWLLDARRKNHEDLRGLENQATLLAIKYQEDAGLDIVADGEQRRDNFFSYIASRLNGVTLMSMADLLDHVDDKASFEAMLNALDVPAFAIKNPVVTGEISVRESLAVEDAQFLRAHTRKAIKVTLPGPYLLSRSTYVTSLTAPTYPTREQMADRFVEILREELTALAAMGVEVVQFDEPVLSEVVLAGKSKTHTFM
jgi:5-methyltetrahydropteroyltriglutamate--homocysteine methyltransferase